MKALLRLVAMVVVCASYRDRSFDLGVVVRPVSWSAGQKQQHQGVASWDVAGSP
jgi:hypothetical protein